MAEVLRTNVAKRLIQGRLLDMNSQRRKTLGVLLAAGAGSRFHGTQHKLHTPINDVPIVVSAFRAMRAAIDNVLVITGASDLSEFPEVTPRLHNADWASGQRSSVLVAIDFAQAHDFDAIVFGLADQPFIEPESWGSLADADSPIAVATYDGVRGNPVRLHRSVWERFISLDSDPDAGARTLIRSHPELVLEVACKGNSADIDTTEDLDSWT